MNTLGWDELVDFFQRAQLRRLLRQGIWDAAVSPRQFHLMSDVYLDCDLGMLRISTIINDSYLSFELVEEPDWSMFEEAGEEDNAGLVDLSYEYFGDRTTVRCHELRCAYVTHPEPQPDFGQIAMASMAVDGGELVTFNPWNFDGLRVQGGVRLEAVLTQIDYLVARTGVRAWTR
jgi:hypothetical protein